MCRGYPLNFGVIGYSEPLHGQKIKRKAANTGGFVFCPAGGKKALQRRLGRKGLPKRYLKGSYFILENRVLVFFKAALKTCSAGTPLSSATRRPT